MSKDYCGDDYCKNYRRYRIFRRILFWIAAVIILVLLAVFIVWLVLRPTKPRYYLRDLSVYQFNLSAPPDNLLSSFMQATVTSRNPNARIGIYYDSLEVAVFYQFQQVTSTSALPLLYQGHKDIVVWSPYLSGSSVPVAPYLCQDLGRDQATGYVQLNVKIDGRIRWKVGSWHSGHYHLDVDCPAFLSFSNGGLHFQQISSCSVNV